MTEILELAVDCAAAYRLTRLVTDDTITQGWRRRFVEAAYVNAGRASGMRAHVDDMGGWDEVARLDPDAPKLATLVTCRYCAGVWLGAAVVAARLSMPRQWRWAARALTAAAVAGLLAGLEQD